MGSKKITKKQRNQAKRVVRKYPFVLAIIFILILAVGVCVLLHRKGIIHLSFLDSIIPQEKVEEDGANSNNPPSGGNTNVDATGGAFSEAEIAEIKTNDLSIHFLELGNKYTGDCTLIKVGDTEVLIDAGSRRDSAAAIKEYVDIYCTDGVLEYVVATHAHQDHIAGFVGNKDGDSRTGIFYQYEIGTLIQFSRTDATTVIYSDYAAAVDMLKENGTTVYTALECWQGGNVSTGARRTFVLDEEKEITLNILYQKYYEQDAHEENDYSVCTLLSQGDSEHYLFTGDLEEEGEQSLLASNDLPKVRLFKAGHHGSKTSNSAALMAVIQPDVVCVCCCCGSDEYTDTIANQFPTQKFTDNVAPYTEKIYVTSIATDDEKGFASMNGTIVVLPKNGEITVRCSNNALTFKETAWFKQHRTWNAA